jgi:hypothetical protein
MFVGFFLGIYAGNKGFRVKVHGLIDKYLFKKTPPPTNKNKDEKNKYDD